MMLQQIYGKTTSLAKVRGAVVEAAISVAAF
jgi:hypothetical protein